MRELQNVIERAVVLSEGETFAIDESWLQATPSRPSRRIGRQLTTLAESEKELIEAALAASHGRVSGPKGAAASSAFRARRSSRKSKPSGLTNFPMIDTEDLLEPSF